MTILITGATGQVGGATVRALVAHGQQVRALVRNPTHATALGGVEIVQGSFEDDASLVRALDGVQSVLLAGRDSPDMVAEQSNVLKNVWNSGVSHVVKLSAIGAEPDSPIELMRNHSAVDAKLKNGPIAWTLLQPHLYLQNLTRSADAVRRGGKLSAPMGDLRIPLVDTRDVGTAAAVILADPAAHAGRTYRFTGPERYGYDDVAAALSTLLGRPVSYEAVLPDALEAELKAAGVPGWRAFDLAHIASAYRSGDYAVSADFEVLVGYHPTSLSAFVADYRDTFLGKFGTTH